MIAGGGASGVLLAHALVRRGRRVIIVEPRTQLGPGLAYSTTCPLHLLNSAAGKMSAIADAPDHFLGWLHARGNSAEPAAFVSRQLYGAYLIDIAREVLASGAGRFRHVQSSVIDAEAHASGVRATLADGSTIDGSALVVAVGNARPSRWANLTAGVTASARFFDSAWDRRATIAGDANDAIVLLGTGLTAVDAVLALRDNGHRGIITMVSRRGLLPHEHRLFDRPPAVAPDAASIRDVLGALRRKVDGRGDDWRLQIDALRGETNARWAAMTPLEQRRIVRHMLPYWNVHRHRMAPAAATSLAALFADGSLRMIAGRTEAFALEHDALRVTVTLRGTDDTIVLTAARVINCSGPEHDIRKRSNPLIRRLIERGEMVANALGIGPRIAANGALIDGGGTVSDRLYALGPVRFGALIETTAIPEIRTQATELAMLLP